MRDKVGTYVDQLWEKIMHVDQQTDHVDSAINEMANQASAIEGSMRNRKIDTNDLAEKVRVFFFMLVTLVEEQGNLPESAVEDRWKGLIERESHLNVQETLILINLLYCL